MPGSDGLGFWVIFEKSSLLRFDARPSGLRFLRWVRPVLLVTTRCAARCWVRLNSQHSKSCISLTLCRKPKRQEGNKSDSNDYTNCKLCSWYSHQMIGTGTGGLGNQRRNEDHLDYGIVKIGPNTKKSPGNLRRLAVTQPHVRTTKSCQVFREIP